MMITSENYSPQEDGLHSSINPMSGRVSLFTLSNGFLLCVWMSSSSVESCSSCHISGSSTFGGSTWRHTKVGTVIKTFIKTLIHKKTSIHCVTFHGWVPVVLQPAEDAGGQAGPRGPRHGQVRGPKGGLQVGHRDLAYEGPLLRHMAGSHIFYLYYY